MRFSMHRGASEILYCDCQWRTSRKNCWLAVAQPLMLLCMWSSRHANAVAQRHVPKAVTHLVLSACRRNSALDRQATEVQPQLMVDTEAATCAAPAVKRRRKNADPRVIVAGVLALLKSVLSQFLNPDKVDAALEKAKELPAVKAMLDLQNCDGSSSGPCLLRSAYNAFVQDFVNKVKAGGVESSLQQAAGIWSVLPEEKKKEIHSRYTGIM